MKDITVGERAEQDVKDGSPSLVSGEFFCIQFQSGPVREYGVNGVQVEDILEVLAKRLEGFQEGSFQNDYNDSALRNIRAAIGCMHARTAERVERGVEGKDEV